MIPLSDCSVFDFQISLNENDLWLQKIPQQLQLLIEERNRVQSASVITVVYDNLSKTTNDYITLTVKLLQEKNDHRNSFIVVYSMYSVYIHESPRNDSMVIFFINPAFTVSFIKLFKYLLINFNQFQIAFIT